MKGFDCNCKLSYDLAKRFKDQGFEFVIRYVGRLQKSVKLDVDQAEINDILKAGLKLGIVQHCPPSPGILPSGYLGIEYGRNAAAFAKEAGYTENCIIYLDLEDVNSGYKNRQSDIVDYCNRWYDEVKKAGYVPGVYVGFNTWLTGSELYRKLAFQHYWKSLGMAAAMVEERGYEMVQSAGSLVNGIEIDSDTVVGDNKGNTPVFMEPEIIDPRIKALEDENEKLRKQLSDIKVFVLQNT